MAKAAILTCLTTALLARASAAPAPANQLALEGVAPNGIRHVFVIVLENRSFESTFGAQSGASYVARDLPVRGALLDQYYAIGHNSLPNYIALVSGQAPNEATQGDCVRFEEFRPSSPQLDGLGQAAGEGCVYPRSVPTLPDQLEAAHLTWKGYMEDMGRDRTREASTCAHAGLNQPDPLLEATPGDEYASKHNPFVYFHSIIDDPRRCNSHVVNLERLERDLARRGTTPNFVFITPNLCHDGHDVPCADGEPGGLVSIDAFLSKWVPRIVSSAAYRQDGLIIITFDESDGAGAEASSDCCGEHPLPGARFPPGLNGPGGGRIGAVLLSPLIRPGTVSAVPYNHYALLRSVEAIFALPPLGYAADPQLKAFGADIFTAAARAR